MTRVLRLFLILFFNRKWSTISHFLIFRVLSWSSFSFSDNGGDQSVSIVKRDFLLFSCSLCTFNSKSVLARSKYMPLWELIFHSISKKALNDLINREFHDNVPLWYKNSNNIQVTPIGECVLPGATIQKYIIKL